MWVRAGVVDLQILGTAVHASSVGQRFGGDGAGLLGVEPKGAQDQGCRIGAGLAPCLMPLKSTEVAAVIDRQERHITAAHAYTVDRTVPGIRMKP